MSRGPFRISTLRCPEVGLEFRLEASIGRFRILTLRCPEVGLELCEILVLAAAAVARKFVDASTI